VKTPFPKLKNRSHRAFVDWYRQQPDRLPVPVSYGGRKRDSLQLTLTGLHPALVVTLTWELVIAVEWQDHCWDLLACFEAAPIHRTDGYYCDLCLPEAQVPYHSREALWQNHLFEPFADWLTHKLLPARWLGLYSLEGRGVTWAKLLDEPDAEAEILLPVWPEKNQP
jgi:hypothetical protein